MTCLYSFKTRELTIWDAFKSVSKCAADLDASQNLIHLGDCVRNVLRERIIAGILAGELIACLIMFSFDDSNFGIASAEQLLDSISVLVDKNL